MAEFKLTLIFNAERRGWTESFYMDYSSYATADVAAQALLEKRIPLLGIGAKVEAYRLSDIAVAGDALLYTPPVNNVINNQTQLVRDVPEVAALARIQATDNYRRQLWLRGIPDDWASWNQTVGVWNVDPDFKAKFDAFAAILTNRQFKVYAISKAPADVRSIKITNLTTVVTATEISAPGHTFVVGDKVRVKGCKGVNASLVNGVWDVFAVTLDTFTVRNNIPPGTAYFYSGGGVAMRQFKKMFQIDRCTFERIAKRDTGRAFFVPRGRRKAGKK